MTRPCFTLILLVLLLISVVADNLIGSPEQNDVPNDQWTIVDDQGARRSRTSPRKGDSSMPSPERRVVEPGSPSDSDSDSGRIQPAIEMTRSERDTVIQALEASLLNMFGLTARPKPSKKVHIPQYMLDLYKQHLSGQMGGSRGGVRATSGRTFFTANTIRSFYSTGNEEGSEDSQNLMHFIFNVSSVPEDESLEGAELRLYREGVNSSTHRHQIEVHEVLRPRSSTRDVISRLIDTRGVGGEKSTWDVFDISALVAKWRREPAKNHGLEVRVLDTDREPTHLKHVRLKRSAHMDSQKWKKEQPIVVTYSSDGKNKVSKRTKRNRAKKRRNRNNRKRRNCKRRSLYVDFEEVGWNDWIVAPPGYDAYFCHGECPFVLADHLNSTNHAIVQNLVNSVDPMAVPKPCCVPTELSAISILYLDQDEKVTLKNYQNMVVEACGCR